MRSCPSGGRRVGTGRSVTSRCLAAEIAEACVGDQLTETLVQIITDPSEDIGLRREAIHPLEELPERTDLPCELIPLVLAPLPDDQDDEFKATLLRLLWPKYLTVQQLISVLTKPKDNRLMGGYKAILNHLHEKVPDEAVADLLSFLVKLDEVYNLYEPSEFRGLLRGMIERAWQLVEQPAVLDNLTQIILRLYQNHQTFFIPDDEQKRRLVALQVLLRADGDRLYMFRLTGSYQREPRTLVIASDWDWLTPLFIETKDSVLRTRVAELLSCLYTVDNTSQTDQVITLAAMHPEIRRAFAYWLETVHLYSRESRRRRREHLENRRWREREERTEEKDGEAYTVEDTQG